MSNVPSAKTRKFYADKIGSALGKSVEGFIEAGRWLVEAKEGPNKLPHGDFEKMVREDLTMDSSVAQRLMKINRNPVLANPAHVQLLPPSWGTLYELTKVEPKLLTAAIKDGRVNPKMERKEVAALLPEKPKANAKPVTKPKSQPRATPVLDKARRIVRAHVEATGKQPNARKLGQEYDISHVHVETAIAVERAVKEAEPLIDPDSLSMTAQDKLALAIKQATRRLEVEIEKRVHEENLKWWKGQLDRYTENARHYEAVLKVRNGIMTKADYRSILSCLHPDRVQDEGLKRRYEHAFNLFTKLEKLMLNEKESPTTTSGLPKTVEELLKRKAEYQAQRTAERAAKRGSNVPSTRH